VSLSATVDDTVALNATTTSSTAAASINQSGGYQILVVAGDDEITRCPNSTELATLGLNVSGAPGGCLGTASQGSPPQNLLGPGIIKGQEGSYYNVTGLDLSIGI
jgi:hypothetical protein